MSGYFELNFDQKLRFASHFATMYRIACSFEWTTMFSHIILFWSKSLEFLIFDQFHSKNAQKMDYDQIIHRISPLCCRASLFICSYQISAVGVNFLQSYKKTAKIRRNRCLHIWHIPNVIDRSQKYMSTCVLMCLFIFMKKKLKKIDV